MDWINSPAAWEAKALAAEVAHQLAEAGRLCSERDCLGRAEIALPVMRGNLRWKAGFCVKHALEFACESKRVSVGVPRRLQDEEALAGPVEGPEEPDLDY